MRNFLFIIITLYSFDGLGQNSFKAYYNGNLCKSFYGKIAENDITVFFQKSNDTLVNGYYYYNKYGTKIKITGFYYENSMSGFFKEDSLLLFELNKDSLRTAIFKGYSFKAKHDSSKGVWSKSLGFTGKWVSLENRKRFDFELHEQNVLDLNAVNYSLVLKDSIIKYVLPIYKYLDKKFNYSYANTCNTFINNNLYSIFIFTYKPLLNSDLSPEANIFMYIRFDDKGIIDNVETIDLNSPKKRIAYKLNYGSFYLKDSLSLDIYRFNDKTKVNLTMNKSLDKGLALSYDTLKEFPIYLNDTLKLQLDKEYNLVFHYLCYYINGNSSYDYTIDSIYERDNKNISKLSNFCEDLKSMCMATFDNSKVTFSTPKIYNFDDYNFDGYNDIYIFNNEEAGANNRAQTIWLYNPKTEKYEKDLFLSKLNIWSVDNKNKTITSGWRTGAQIYSTITYQLNKGKFIKIATEDSYRNDSNNTVIVRKRILIGNKWIEEKQEY